MLVGEDADQGQKAPNFKLKTLNFKHRSTKPPKNHMV